MNWYNTISHVHSSSSSLSPHISRVIRYSPGEQICSLIAPHYNPFIGPILVWWEDYCKGNLTLTIGQYHYTRNEGRFTDEVVCRDVMGALVLLMNLQLENFNNKKSESSDSSTFRIKKTTIDQVNSFGRVNKSFCQFALDFISMLLVFDTWSSHVSQTVRRMILP